VFVRGVSKGRGDSDSGDPRVGAASKHQGRHQPLESQRVSLTAVVAQLTMSASGHSRDPQSHVVVEDIRQ